MRDIGDDCPNLNYRHYSCLHIMNSSRKQGVDGYSQPFINDPHRLLVCDGDIDFHVAADGMSRTVAGHAIAPSSRVNTSRCDRKCRFPSMGGLHCSSNDSSIPTALTNFLIWCHVDKSNSPSSSRTHVAALAYISKKKTIPKGQPVTTDSSTNLESFPSSGAYWKMSKCPPLFVPMSNGWPSISSRIRPLTNLATINTEQYHGGNVCILSILRGDLWVHDMTNSQFGLCMHLPSVKFPVFICLPRQKSLSIPKDGSVICQAMNSCACTQPQSLVRGFSKQVFTDGHPRLQPGRAEGGVSPVYTNLSMVSHAVIETLYLIFCNVLNMRSTCLVAQTWFDISSKLRNMFHI